MGRELIVPESGDVTLYHSRDAHPGRGGLGLNSKLSQEAGATPRGTELGNGIPHLLFRRLPRAVRRAGLNSIGLGRIMHDIMISTASIEGTRGPAVNAQREESEAVWYRDGLAFECTRCGDCCRGAPGFVWVDREEMERLAAALGLSLEEFGRRFLRMVGRRISLIEKPGGDCVFWDQSQGCLVYEARPTQCRTWPFWPENLETPRDWKRTCDVCPGSGQGRVYPVETIRNLAGLTPP